MNLLSFGFNQLQISWKTTPFQILMSYETRWKQFVHYFGILIAWCSAPLGQQLLAWQWFLPKRRGGNT